MEKLHELDQLVAPIRDDLLSGAAEIALRAITAFQTMLQGTENMSVKEVEQRLISTAHALTEAQPAMAPLFHLSNKVLLAIRGAKTVAEVHEKCQEALMKFEKQLCESAEAIADLAFELIPPGELVFAYSFSSTVVSALVNARSKGRFFRVVCTEARPALEGRKFATMLAAGGIEVMHTFDNALGLVLPQCRAAFMGLDCLGRPGVVNKVGSWPLAMACKELNIPMYALCGTEKFVDDERVFEFEKHDRPGEEVWEDAPKGVRILNRQFELIPLSWLSGIVTENGILTEKDIGNYVSKLEVHEALKLESSAFL